MKIPQFGWVLITLVLGFGFLLILITNKNNQIYTDVKIPINIEVFSDYNCAHCAELEPEIEAAKAKYRDKIVIEQKNLTLSENFGPTSLTYAHAAEAARKQNKFDEYSEALFKWNTYISNPNNKIYTYSKDEKNLYSHSKQIDIISLAKFYKLDISKFQKDMNSQEITDKVSSETADATRRLGVPSPPAIFIFGQQFKPNTLEEFDVKIDELIKIAEN